MTGLFDKFKMFKKITFFEGVLCQIYFENERIYDYYNFSDMNDTENKLLQTANLFNEELFLLINKLKASDWKITKDECERNDYDDSKTKKDNHNERICEILIDSDFVIKDEKYYYANENLKDIFE